MKLSDWVTERKMSITEMSARLNVDRSLLFRWKKGTRRIGPKTLKLLRDITLGKVNEVDDVKD